MIPVQLLRFIAGCIVINVIIIGIATKYSGEEVSFVILSIKIGIPLVLCETMLMIAFYPDETFDVLINDGEFFREIFDSESDQTFAHTNAIHAIHSHGDVAENSMDDNFLRRRNHSLSPTTS